MQSDLLHEVVCIGVVELHFGEELETVLDGFEADCAEGGDVGNGADTDLGFEHGDLVEDGVDGLL